jgi:hypothetical protein
MSRRYIGTWRNADTAATDPALTCSNRFVTKPSSSSEPSWKPRGRQLLHEDRQEADVALSLSDAMFPPRPDAVQDRLSIIQAMKDSCRAGMHIAVDLVVYCELGTGDRWRIQASLLACASYQSITQQKDRCRPPRESQRRLGPRSAAVGRWRISN